ncbi:hypothetical protein TRFO_42171 [Tritrichomonas foetus]|uniref:CBM20 domain-containing protein n=1 Tax=Tritrichomonas foetus TaxID=1144522 RepID=A0A1J4KYL5_9EUKA|nr:hypothetical protein TRFO_42171 [Tritrichomonas foetus]|eukprot:OHT15968.1 hypothetical protein TRFO_42171 [Tritrichomonas foetus]
MTQLDNITINFRVRYHAVYGQNVMICGSIPELGNWTEAIPLEYTGTDDYWATTIHVPLSTEKTSIRYKYIIEYGGNKQWEPEKDHVLNVSPSKTPYTIDIIDTYKWQDSVMDSYTRSVFVDAINRRDSPPEVNYINSPSNEVELFISAVILHVKSTQQVVVVGSCPELGSWNVDGGLKLSDGEFPLWTGTRSISRN